MALIPRPFISWSLDQNGVNARTTDLDFDPSPLRNGQGVVSLHQENNDMIIRDTRTTGTSVRFSLGSVNPMYASTLIGLFKGAIEESLMESRPQPSSFLPLLLYTHPTPTPHQLALFGYKTTETSPLHRWRWALWNEADRTNSSFLVNDPQTQLSLESLRLSGLDSLPFHERNQRLAIKAIQNANDQIIGMEVKFNRENSSSKDALIQYLTNPADLNRLETLKQLGLSPEQIQILCTDDELRHFRNVTGSLKTLPEATASTLVNGLRQNYPTIFPALWAELIQANNAERQDNTYPTIVNTLQQKVSGQDYATNSVAAALNAQLNSDHNAYFLFVGPTGVGKTEMAKAASGLKMNRMARFDMDQFKGEVDSNKLFGSAAGYVGSTDKALFAKAIEPFVHSTSGQGGVIVKEVRNMVVLFDEFEKAHAQVKQGLLTLFGEGYVQVQHTEEKKNIVTKYVFTKSLFISTSNAYQAQIVHGFANGLAPKAIEETFTRLNAEDARNPNKYSPELLGRLQIVPFNPIPRTQFPELVRRKLPSLLKNLQEKVGCKTLIISDQHLDHIINHLSRELYGDGTGIRRLLQYFEHTLYQVICAQSNTWGNFKDIEMEILPLGGRLGISCKETLYGQILQEYPPVLV